jgi:hypothetical protein
LLHNYTKYIWLHAIFPFLAKKQGFVIISLKYYY